MSIETSAPPQPDTSAEVTSLLGAALGRDAFSIQQFRDNTRVYLKPERLLEGLTVLRDQGGYRQLAELGGTDYLKYPGKAGSGCRFEVHYVLLNHETTQRIVVKVGVDDPDPCLPSVLALWRGADWMEREVFDMFGIRFEGHPDLRRILMPEEFRAFPLRKDYPLRGRGERHNFTRLTREQS